MSPSTGEHARLDRRRTRAEAAAWIASLHGPGRTREMEDGCRRWLAEHPVHAVEFELATDVWNETAHAPLYLARPLSRDQRTLPRRRWVWRIAAGAAATMVATLVAALWLAHLLGRSVVTTGIGEQKTIELADGSRVTLNTNSRIVVHYGRYTRNVILRYGEAYFQVVHNPTRPFVVRAGDQKVVDVGTSFVVRRNAAGKGSLSVTVIEGRVAVAPVGPPDISPKIPSLEVLFVSAGSRLLLRPHAQPRIQAESAALATAWLRGQLIFNDTDLSDAAAQFNRYNTVHIVVGSARLNRIHVSGLFRIGAAKSFARTVAEDHHLRLIVRRRTLLLERRGDIPDVGQPRRP